MLRKRSSYIQSELIMCLFLVVLATGSITTTATCTIVLRNGWRTDAFYLLVLLFDLLCISLRVRVNPRLTILQSTHNFLLLLRVKLFTETLVLTRSFHSRAHGVKVAIECILCINTLLDFLVLIGKLLSLFDHLLNLLLGEATPH